MAKLYPDSYHLPDWLPTTKKEVTLRGWDQLDVILFTGDAYIDHPAFGASVIGRVLENLGLKVAIVPQPNWQDDLRDFTKLGQPRLFFGITAGNMDSMVNHYTANRRLRSNDAYTPGGKAGHRPDRATLVYSHILKKLFPDTKIIAGGIEASLRRLVHYDYWDDKLLPSIMADGTIDLLAYGSSEKTIIKICEWIEQGSRNDLLQKIPQVAYRIPPENFIPDDTIETIYLNSYEDCQKDPFKQAANFKIIEEESNTVQARRIVQSHGDYKVVVNPSEPPESIGFIDQWYELPYTRLPHPKYWKKPAIPAFEMIRFSVQLHRGCFGGCAFCTISAHQGKHIQSRTLGSIKKEVAQVTKMAGFKGYLSDLGGPSANMYRMEPKKPKMCLRCKRPSCIHPSACPNLNTSHESLINLYQEVRSMPGIKKAFVSSGVRYDLFMEGAKNDKSNHEYPRQLITHHVSGRLKVAPEHTKDHVLSLMRKPSFQTFRQFHKLFKSIDSNVNGNQQLIPYFISSHPACTEEDMAELAAETKDLGIKPEQVQDFTPTPMTLAAEIFYKGIDPYTLKRIPVARNSMEKTSQRRYFFWYDRNEKPWIISRLKSMRRDDLIRRLFY